MGQNVNGWVVWVRVMVDPSAKSRGFSLEDMEFKAKYRTPVEDEMYGTLAGDQNTQPGKFWVVAEDELMRICPQMQSYAQGADWFFPVEFCEPVERPDGIDPVQTRVGSPAESSEALETFQNVQQQLAKKL